MALIFEGEGKWTISIVCLFFSPRIILFVCFKICKGWGEGGNVEIIYKIYI